MDTEANTVTVGGGILADKLVDELFAAEREIREYLPVFPLQTDETRLTNCCPSRQPAVFVPRLASWDSPLAAASDANTGCMALASTHCSLPAS